MTLSPRRAPRPSPSPALRAGPLVAWLAALVVGGAGAPAAAAQDAEPLLVLAAASLTDALPRVARAWEEAGGAPVRFSFAATSRLARQAQAGSEADLFVSADRSWIRWLEARDGLLPGSVRVVATNELVVVVPRGAPPLGGPRGLAELERVVLAGESVPAGRYARAALEARGVWEAVAPRVVRGGSVRGALEWVARGEADAGVVYRTDAVAEPGVEVAFSFSAADHLPVEYPAAVLASSSRPEVARAFLDFLSGPEAWGVLAGAGFGPPPDRPAPGAVAPGAVAPGPRLDAGSAVRLSLVVALLATLVGLVPAVLLGWVLARRDFPGKALVSTLVLAPLVLPPVVTGFLLLSLLGSRSPLGGVLAGLGLPVPFTLLGASLAAMVVGLPLYVLAVRGAFEAVDPHYEEVSRSLGVPPARTFLRVSLPLALPGIAAGAVLAFARALGEFGATVVLAGNVEGETRTIALAVYTLLESPGGEGTTWTLVGASVVLSLLALVGYEALSRRQRDRLERHGGR